MIARRAAALSPATLLIVGCIACLVALAACWHDRAGLAGWLAAYGFWSSLPLGSLCLVMMMRLIPGSWRDDLAPPAEMALRLLPLAAAGFLPILLGIDGLYRWSHEVEHGFRAAYLDPVFFIARAIVFYLCAGLLAWLLLTRRHWSVPLACAGLIVFMPIYTLSAVDWYMSLDPKFHSSGFALYVLSLQCCAALSLLIAARLGWSAGRPAKPPVLGALLLTSLLLWAYFSFMQYLISWSDNLPDSVTWYQRQAAGPWGLVEYAIGASALVPLGLLLLPGIRHSGSWLMALALLVAAGRALEMAWLVLPASTGRQGYAAAVAALAVFGLGTLSTALIRSIEPQPVGSLAQERGRS